MYTDRFLLITLEEDVLKAGRRAGQFGVRTGIERQAIESIEEAELTPKEAAAEWKHPRRILQPDLSTRLISPLEAGDSSPDEAAPAAVDGGVTWGIEVTGVARSSYDGTGVKVAVLDTGIVEHPAFNGLNILKRDFTGEGVEDLNGHGTHCTGTIAGRTLPSEPRFGVAPGIEQLLVGKVLPSKGGGSSLALVQAVMWAIQNGADIISMSLGFDLPGQTGKMIAEGWPAELAASRALQVYQANILAFGALADAGFSLADVGSGTLIVSAAGNESRRNISENYTVGAAPPAAAPGVLSVGALESPGPPHDKLSIAYFSNTGPDVSAPGVSVLSAWNDGATKRISGTSMATPHIAGLAALWWQRNHEVTGIATPDTVRNMLIGRAQTERLAEYNDSVDMGMGLSVAP